jgi:hypothetical protein
MTDLCEAPVELELVVDFEDSIDKLILTNFTKMK